MCTLHFLYNLYSMSLDNTLKLLITFWYIITQYFTIHCLQLQSIKVIFLSIKNLIIILFKIYCAFMLCYNNACLQFTDIKPCANTVPVIPSLICVHDHAVLASATFWLTRRPVCIVQGCPIAPLPGSLHTHTPQGIICTHTALRKLALE